MGFESLKRRRALKKDTLPIHWPEEVFEAVEIQNTNPVAYKIKDWNGEIIEGSFYEPELQKTSQDVSYRESDTEKRSTSVGRTERISRYVQ